MRSKSGKLSNIVLTKVRANLARYNQLKKITADQHKDYSVDTSRYNASMKWYEIIRSTFEEWRDRYPNDAALIGDIYKIGAVSTKSLKVDGMALKHHYSISAMYTIKKSFELEIAFKAIKCDLITL